MKLIVLKENLLEGLIALDRVVSGGNLPILKNILFLTEKGRIVLKATNLEIGVEKIISGKIVKEGECTVPLTILSSVIRNVTSSKVTLEQKGKILHVTTDNYEARIQAQDVKDFPIIPTIQSTNTTLTISSQVFVDVLSGVIPSAQYSTIRPEISGVFVSGGDDKITFVATDSFRLTERTITHQIATPFNVIVPLRTAEEVVKLFQQQKEDMSILVDQNQILFTNSTQKLISRVVDGVFPEYSALIPKETKTEIAINRGELVSGVKLTSSFSGKSNDITLKITENKKGLELNSSDALLGENHYSIPIKCKGPVVTAVLNWRYILDGLKIYSESDVSIVFSAQGKPVLIKADGNTTTTYVLMPISLTFQS